jgi:hypothetical protein
MSLELVRSDAQEANSDVQARLVSFLMSSGVHSASFFLCRETFVANLYGLRAVGSQGVPPGGGESILSDRLSYLLALHRVWVRLSKGVVCH